MDEKMQQALRRASQEVESAGIADPELKKIAFAKAVDYYLNESSEPVKSSRAVSASTDSNTNFWSKLAKATEISEKSLKDLYTVKDGQILLILRDIRGDSKADRQRSLAVAILYAYYEGMDCEWVPSTLLSEAAKHSGLYDTSKFAKNLKHPWFRAAGKKKGVTYKLSAQGMNEAKGMLNTEVRSL